jgi:threonine dehydratase
VPAVTRDDVLAAASRLEGRAVRTPTLVAAELSERLGATVFLKCENLQVAGAFKFRGAYNRLVQLSAEERAAGVVAWSSGNHAQGVAAAGRLLDIPCTIVMPADAPAVKIANTRGFGAEVVPYDRWTEDREQIGRAIAAERGAVVVPPYDDPHIIAGQGTVALELDAAVRANGGGPLDALLVPCSGGGLVAGCALALSGTDAATRVYSVEPAGFDDTARSLRSGSRERADPDARSICDALLSPLPGEVTFPINRELLAGGLVVTDDQVLDAIHYAWNALKLVVEPGGAVALAALLAGAFDARGQRVGIILSGGNIDAPVLARTLD